MSTTYRYSSYDFRFQVIRKRSERRRRDDMFDERYAYACMGRRACASFRFYDRRGCKSCSRQLISLRHDSETY